MWEFDFGGLQEHAGADAKSGGSLFTALDPGVAVVAYDGVIAMQKVAADLVKAAGLRLGFDKVIVAEA